MDNEDNDLAYGDAVVNGKTVSVEEAQAINLGRISEQLGELQGTLKDILDLLQRN